MEKRDLSLSMCDHSGGLWSNSGSQSISTPRPLLHALLGLLVPVHLPSACPHVQRACAANDVYAPVDPLLILPLFSPFSLSLSLSCFSPLPGSPSVLIEVNARCSASASSLLVRGQGWKCIRHCRGTRGGSGESRELLLGRERREREKERREEGEGERDRHEAPVEEALYTGWILVRPSVTRPNSRHRHRHREHHKHSQLSETAIIWAAEEVCAKAKGSVRSDSRFRPHWERDKTP